MESSGVVLEPVYSDSLSIVESESETESVVEAEVNALEEGLLKESGTLADAHPTIAESEGYRKYKARKLYASVLPYVKKIKNGTPINGLRARNGNRLDANEFRALMRILPVDYNPYKSGRKYEVNKDGGYVDTVYMCDFNLAGRFYVCTNDGVMHEVPLQTINDDCAHKWCSSGNLVKRGNRSDAIVMVVPFNSIELKTGVFVPEVAGSMEFWKQAYPYAVKAVSLMNNTVTAAEVRAILGTQYKPKSLFCQTIVFMARMLGLKSVGFIDYFARRDMFDDMLCGVPGMCDEFTRFWSLNGHRCTQNMPKAAWSLHYLCKLRAVYDIVNIPFRYYLENLQTLRHGSVKAIKAIVDEYLSSGDVKSATLASAVPSVKDDDDILSVTDIGKIDRGRLKGSSAVIAMLFSGRLEQPEFQEYAKPGVDVVPLVVSGWKDKISTPKSKMRYKNFKRSQSFIVMDSVPEGEEDIEIG